MMKLSRYRGALCAAVLSIFTLSSQAALVSRLGGQAYYDTALDVTRLANANYADTQMTWDQATWATNLNIDGVTCWQLPDTNPIYGNCVQ